jgi:uncharacterized protein
VSSYVASKLLWHCGQRMPEVLSAGDSAHCAACSAPVRASSRFCANCGAALGVFANCAPPASTVDTPPIPSPGKIDRYWHELKAVGWLFGVLLLSSFVCGIVTKFDDSPWPQTIAAGIDALVVFAFVMSRFTLVSPLLLLPRVRPRAVFDLVVGSVAVALVLVCYFALLKHLGMATAEYRQIYEKAHWPVWSIFVLVSVVPAVVEEIAFRGVIQSLLEQLGSGAEAWLIQAALFSVLHLTPLIFPSHFVMGLWFGWLRWRTRSVYPGMVMHGLWNAVVLLVEA